MSKKELVKQFVSELPNQVFLVGVGCWAFGVALPDPYLFTVGSFYIAAAFLLLANSMLNVRGRLKIWNEKRKEMKA